MATLSPEDRERYSRHMILPEVGPEGQARLATAKVAIVGVGGLGSPIALYCAAAGVGQIGIIDPDDVGLSNLQRQILYGTSDVGSPKVAIAREKLKSLNPKTKVETYPVALSSENAFAILREYDIVADATDNFRTRYLLNDACALMEKPLVFGSVHRFEGTVTVFRPPAGPCYRCLHPEPPPPGSAPNCAEAGVLGVLPGMMGALQAAEVLKLILSLGDSLVGRVLKFDALKGAFHVLRLPKDPACPLCGTNPTIRELVEIEPACAMVAEKVDGVKNPMEIEPGELKAKMDAGKAPVILDVREPFEHEICAIESVLIPLRELPERFEELDPSAEIVVYCHHGRRSLQAVQFLRDKGYPNTLSLAGGIDRWSDEIDPDMAKY